MSEGPLPNCPDHVARRAMACPVRDWIPRPGLRPSRPADPPARRRDTVKGFCIALAGLGLLASIGLARKARR